MKHILWKFCNFQIIYADIKEVTFKSQRKVYSCYKIKKYHKAYQKFQEFYIKTNQVKLKVSLREI